MISPSTADIIADMAADIDEEYMIVIRHVIRNWDKFVEWPTSGTLFLPDVDRSVKYHTYSYELILNLKAKKIAIDTRSNGPAIIAYQHADGKRPYRRKANRQWSVHHIYDGQFPWPSSKTTLHAVKSGDHFTHSAGLVAIHPIADALADEFGYFAWLLRAEAYHRFGYDPDNVFQQ